MQVADVRVGPTAAPLARFRVFALLACITTLALLTACAAPANVRSDTKFQSYASAADRPALRPVRSMSNFSESLMCMDRMFREAQLPTTLITSKQIPDFSTRVAVATKDMIITSLSQMSRLSNAFRYVDYEVDIARQDTVQNLTTILLNNNQIQLQRPALYFSGAIAFVDQNVLNNRTDLGTSGSRLDAGLSQNRVATIVALELHLGDFRSRTLIPGLDSANEVVIGNGVQGLDLAGRIGRYGVQFNVGRDYTQGTGAAVRTLVELATIELVGKWARVPYWQCLTLEQTNPNFQRQMRDWFDEGSPSVYNNLVQRSLVSQGYLVSNGSALDANNAELIAALGKFQADSGMVVSGVVDFETYGAISFIKEIFIAKKALAAYFVSSALFTSMNSNGFPCLTKGAYNLLRISMAFSLSVPITTLSGFMKSSTATPSLKNSGLLTTQKLSALPPFAKMAS